MANQEQDQVPLHFFRAILSPELGRMKIASDFAKYHENTISEDVFLQVNDGSLAWKVGVQRLEGEIWLVEGWKEFAEHYSIRYGHILMFGYKGESRFDVSIYDPSLMETRYPGQDSSERGVESDLPKVVKTDEEEGEKVVVGEEKEEDDKEIKDGMEDDDEDDNNDEEESDQAELVETDHDGEEEEEDDKEGIEDGMEDADENDEDEEEFDQAEVVETDHDGEEEEEDEEEEDGDEKFSEKRTQYTQNAWIQVDARAKAFRSSNPCFTVRMQRRYVAYKNCSLVIPIEHSRKHILGKENKGMYLVGEGGRRCFANYYVRKGRWPQVYLLMSGWKDFMLQNALRLGDVCVFELVDSTKLEYKVTVFRIADYEEEKEEEGHDDDEECPQRRHESKGKSLASHSSKNKKTQPATAARNRVLKRAEAYGKYDEERTRRATNAQTRVYARAEAYTSPNPCCIVRMQPSYVTHRKCILCLPIEHSRRHILGKENKVLIFVDEDGMRWSMSYQISKRFQVRLHGWKDFAKMNRIRIGDVCVFELVDRVDLVYNVIVFRIDDHKEEEDDNGHRTSHPSRAQEVVNQKARAFQSPNPSFTITLKQCHLAPKMSVYIPQKHGRDYLLEKGAGEICLKNGDKAWIATYTIECPPLHRVRLSSPGWRLFSKENCLRVGDACVFELVDSAKTTYEVTIFRIADHA